MRETARSRVTSPDASRAPQSGLAVARHIAVVTRPAQSGGLTEPEGRLATARDFTLLPTHGAPFPFEATLEPPDAGGGGARAPAPPAATPPTFPDFATMTGHATVSAAMTAAWSATKAATTSTSRREQGFWIKYDTAASTYDCSPTFTGPSVGNNATGAADPGTKPADSGAIYTVGLYHTHTPMTHRTGTRNIGPSSADERYHTAQNVAGVVNDYVESPAGSGSIPGGHPLDSPARLYSSGPNRRS